VHSRTGQRKMEAVPGRCGRRARRRGSTRPNRDPAQQRIQFPCQRTGSTLWPAGTIGSSVVLTPPDHQRWPPWSAHRTACPEQPGNDLGGSGTGAVPYAVRFQSPPVKPCVRFSRTRLTDVLHRRRSTRQSRKGLGEMTAPSRLIRPRWLGDRSTWRMPQSQDRRRLPILDNSNATLRRA